MSVTVLDMLLWAFSSTLSSFVFKNTYTLNTCIIALFAGHRQGFVAHTGIVNLLEVVSCHHWRCTLLSLILSKHKSALISCSTRSSKLPSWLSTPHIDCEEWRKGCMHGTNRKFEQTPFSHIWLKVTCKKGGVFSWAYGTSTCYH